MAACGSTKPGAPERAAESDAPSDPGYVSRVMLGEEWPFTVEDGVLGCDGGNGVGAVTFSTGGSTYPVNGLAKQQVPGIEIDPIWAPDPAIEGAKKNIGPIVDRGLALCE